MQSIAINPKVTLLLAHLRLGGGTGGGGLLLPLLDGAPLAIQLLSLNLV
jgi:hypothetical protein